MELTEGSFWAGNGRRWKLGVEGRSSGKTAMAGDGPSSISAGFGHGRARGWSEWVRGEVAQLRVQRIEVGRRGPADAASTASSARLGSARARGMEKGRTGLEASRNYARRRAASSAIADAWKLAAGHSRRYGVGRLQEKH